MTTASGVQRQTLGRRGVAALLNHLDAASLPPGTTGYWTALVPPEVGMAQVAGALAQSLPEEAIAAAEKSGTGAAFFWCEGGGLALIPPFPLKAQGLSEGWNTGVLRALLAREYLLGVVLLRLEGYAVGVFQGDRLLDSRTGARWIHGRTRKGGQSQRRFERTREKHIQELFDDACQAARDKFTPYASRLDYLVFGGDRHTLQAFLNSCLFLKSYGPRTLARVLPIVAPKRATLERLPALLWQSQALIWPSSREFPSRAEGSRPPAAESPES